jgi:hypothetical protein
LLDPELGSEAMDLIRSMITEIKAVPGARKAWIWGLDDVLNLSHK